MKIKDRKFIVCDFETSTYKWLKRDDGVARVWLWGMYNIFEDSFHYGIDMDSFMKNVLVRRGDYNPIYYFHNLKFDGSYIVSWLLENGFKYDDELSNKFTFSASISDVGLWYMIRVRINNAASQKYIITFQDSLKKIPLPVRDIPKAFGIEDEAKGEIDYDEYREVGHMPTEKEVNYLKHDCTIVAKAMMILENNGFTKMTGSSDAFYQWKKTLLSERARRKGVKPEIAYREIFPCLTIDEDDYIRKAYRGGWTYVNPKYAGYIIDRPVEVWDINSMYPSKMKEKYLPIGEPRFFRGKPKPTKYQCYISHIMIAFEIKKDHLPCIQIKNSYYFTPTEYLTSSDNHMIELWVTNVDLKMIFSQYNVLEIEYLDGMYFNKTRGYFDEHIDKNMEIKERAKGGERQIAKNRMNQVYGKTATAPRRRQKIPYLDEDGIIQFRFSDYKIEKPEYTALGVFITSWARYDIIKDAQNNYDRFIYCDTDSLHLLKNEDGTEPDLPIHQTKLGFYKKEHNVIKSIFLRSKTYVEQYDDGRIEVKCAGASPEVKKNMNFDNFKIGSTFEGKLMPIQVKGGCVLCKTYFTIK